MRDIENDPFLSRVFLIDPLQRSPHTINSATTEAGDNFSSELNVKMENNSNEKSQSPKNATRSEGNLEDKETFPNSIVKKTSSNFQCDKKTIDAKNNIQPKQKSADSGYTFEIPESIFDNAFQNHLMDKSNILFNSNCESIDINDIKGSLFPNGFGSNNMNIGKWKKINLHKYYPLNEKYFNYQNLVENDYDNFNFTFPVNEPKIFDDVHLSFESEQSPIVVQNNINGVIFNSLNDSNSIPNLMDENNTNFNQTMNLNEEEENRDDILAQILIILRSNNFKIELENREFGEQIKHGGILRSNSKKHINKFIKKHDDLAKYALYFEENAPSFFDKRIIKLKKRILDYAHKLINIMIENKNYKLACIDYDKTEKIIKASFNLNLLNSQLSSIFSEYIDKSHNNNSEIINYIENSKNNESKAHCLLSMKLKDFITKVFNKDESNGLDLYLNLVKDSLNKIEFTDNNEKIGEDLRNKKLKAIYEIDKTLSENIEEYFQSKKGKEKKEKNMNNID